MLMVEARVLFYIQVLCSNCNYFMSQTKVLIWLASAQPGLGFSLHLVLSSPHSGMYIPDPGTCLYLGFSYSIPSLGFPK
jgi:hypothetical protein